MAKLIQETLSANGDTSEITWIGSGKGTVVIYGDDGGGTVTGHVSADSGTTYVALKDDGGTAISTTAAAMFNFEINGDQDTVASVMRVKFTLAGATTPTLNIAVFDAR
jgi:hypothetical protein